jgi:hypothetical protein
MRKVDAGQVAFKLRDSINRAFFTQYQAAAFQVAFYIRGVAFNVTAE